MAKARTGKFIELMTILIILDANIATVDQRSPFTAPITFSRITAWKSCHLFNEKWNDQRQKLALPRPTRPHPPHKKDRHRRQHCAYAAVPKHAWRLYLYTSAIQPWRTIEKGRVAGAPLIGRSACRAAGASPHGRRASSLASQSREIRIAAGALKAERPSAVITKCLDSSAARVWFSDIARVGTSWFRRRPTSSPGGLCWFLRGSLGFARDRFLWLV